MKAIQTGESLVTQVGDRIRAGIEAQELTPGQLYSVNSLATELGVSRTPVREALLGLARAGLVRIERNRGFTVVQPTEQHIREVFEVRILLESWAARRAAEAPAPDRTSAIATALETMVAAARTGDLDAFAEHDVQFHQAVLAAAGNPVLAAAVQATRDAVLALGVSTVGWSRTADDIVEEHRPILAAIVAEDPAAADAAMDRHLTHTRDLLVQRVSAPPRS